MKKTKMTLENVQKVYSGPEGKLWELIMGEQIHVGGWKSSMELANLAGIKKGMDVLDLCSALAGGLRFLVKNFGVKGYGLDGTMHMIRESRRRIKAEKLENRICVKYGDVIDIPWPEKTFDIVWGEDAWCYVVNKPKLIAEAAKVLKSGGTIAFTDWVEGEAGLSDSEADRINNFMKFPYMETRANYEMLLERIGLEIKHSHDLTEDFAKHIRLYIEMLTEQLSFDALNIIGGDIELFRKMGAEMAFMLEMAESGKFGRARLVATKR